MDAQISVSVAPNAAGAELLKRIAAAISTNPNAVATSDAADAPKKRGRPSKVEMEARKRAEEESDDSDEVEDEKDEDENEVEDEEEVEEETDEDEEEDEEKEKPAATSMVKAALACAKKHGRPAVKKILDKFGVKSPQDIPKAKHAAALKLFLK